VASLKAKSQSTVMENMPGRYFATALVSLALSACLSFDATAQLQMTPDAAARQWLFYVDGGDYVKGWERAGDLLKAQIAEQDLQSKIAPVREPLGAIMERKLIDVKLSNTMPGLPDGKYAVVQFNSSFANKAVAVETVALETEDDRWAAIGYFIK
jgi:hypothetical protein